MVNKYFYNLSVTIIGIVTGIFILTTVGGLFHIPVNPFFVLLPFIGGGYYLKKQSPENIDFLKQFLFLLLIIMISYLLAISVWDGSWDGRWYHSAAIILLKNGWLPVYQNYADFAVKCHVYPPSAFWGNCYLHFVEIIGANIYKITNLIESAKAVNFIILSAVFMYSYSVLKEFKPQKKIMPLILSAIIILNPVCICQWFTNYIDLHLYFAFTLLVLTIIKIELQQETTKTDLFIFVCSSLMPAITKLTGCFYLFVIYLIYFIYLLLLKRNIKKFIKTVLITGGLIAVTSVNPFYTNFRDYGHPFYPLFGNSKINIMDESLPYGFQNMSAIERFLRSNFSDSVNSMSNCVNQPELMRYPVKLKIPFTINNKTVLHRFYHSDVRVGGFGYFWSGILLLSIFYLPFIRFRNKNEKYLFLLITAIILSTTFANPQSWWARYVPQFWLFPVFILLFGLLQENYKTKTRKILKLLLLYLVIISFIVNSSVVLFQNSQFNFSLTKILKEPYKTPANKIYLMVSPNEPDITADETIIPHLEEYYGKENIIYVPYDESKIISKDFLQIQNEYIIKKPYYFFKPEK